MTFELPRTKVIVFVAYVCQLILVFILLMVFARSTESRDSRRSLSPVVSPVNMLKALHYHSRRGRSLNGLYAAQSETHIDHLTQNDTTLHSASSAVVKTAGSAYELRMLAAAYSSETVAPSRSTQRSTYRLTSVIVHLGDVSSGHFVTYRRAPSLNGQRFPSDWLYTSDLCVRRATISEVFASDAYMLLYEKM